MSVETGFEIQKSSNGTNWTTIATVGANVTTYTDTQAVLAQANYYRVRAFNGQSPVQTYSPSGFSSYSNTANVTPAGDTSETGFKVERKRSDEGGFSALVTKGQNVATHTDTDLNGNYTYQYRVKAYNAIGESSYSNIVTTGIIDFTATELYLAELYKILLDDGSTYLYYTSHDTNLVYQGNTYVAIPIKRSEINFNSNLQIDKVDIECGLVGVTVGAGDFTIPEVIERGWLERAHVWVYLVNYITLISHKLLFEGHVTGGIGYNQGTLHVECNSTLDKLASMFPKKIYSEDCQHALYDTYCGLVKASYLESGTVASVTDRFRVHATIFQYSAHASGYWLGGEVKFTSGDNTNVRRSIKSHGDGYVDVRIAFPDTIVVGNTLQAYPGCDKKGETCEDKFDNYENFFGFEYIPKPEVLYGYS